MATVAGEKHATASLHQMRQVNKQCVVLSRYFARLSLYSVDCRWFNFSQLDIIAMNKAESRESYEMSVQQRRQNRYAPSRAIQKSS